MLSLKKFVLVLLMISLVVTIGAFSANVLGENQIKGKVIFTTQRTDKIDKELPALAAEFAKAYPGAQIEFEGIKDAENLLKTRMATHSLADVTLVIDQLVRTDYPKFFVPIDDLGFTEKNIIDYQRGINPAEKKLYTVTHAANYDGFVYNKKVFRECGITKVPTTVAELLAACEKIKAKGIIPVASNYKDLWPLNDYCMASGYFNTGDPDYYNKLAKKDKFLVDDGGPLTMFKILRTLNQKGYLEPDLASTSWDSFRRDFPAGKIGMALLGSWYPPQFADMGGSMEEVGMFPVPGAKYIFAGGDWTHAVNKESENIATAKAALKWLWENGRYANAIGMVPPQKGITYPQAFVNELLGRKLPIVNQNPDQDAWNKVYNKMQVDIKVIAQEYIIAKDPAAVVKKYNDKWAKAKK